MKDVSKQTLEDLITFIYFGEVNVEQRNLDEFKKIVAALKIKGLDGLIIHSNRNIGPVSTRSTPVVHHGSQYQSTQITQVHWHAGDEFKGVQNSAHDNIDGFSDWADWNSGPNHDEMKKIGKELGTEKVDDYHYCDDMDQQGFEQESDDYGENGFQENDNKSTNYKKHPIAKRAKRTNGNSNEIQ